MGYEYDYASAEMSSEMLLAVLGIVAAILGVILLVGLLGYILGAIGTSAIARRRGIPNAWLAWLPVGQQWIWGCIADQYQFAAKGQQKNRRMVILILSLASVILSVQSFGTVMAGLSQIVADPEALEYMTEAELVSMFAGSAGGLLGSVLSLVLTVLQYIVLYDLFTSCDPSSSGIMLVLSILFSFLCPIFIFAQRNKDLGMPQRTVNPDRTQEPWNNT